MSPPRSPLVRVVVGVAGAGASVLLLSMLGDSPADAAPPACTIRGTARADQLVGTARSDVICGLGGADVLIGRGGNDTLRGGRGRDTMVGGSGRDVFEGGASADTVSYSDHDSPVTADLDGSADDGARGERDRIAADVENLVGGSARDRLNGNGARNRLDGAGGVDVVSGAGGADVLYGKDAGDKLFGDAGDDRLSGGADNDFLSGGTGHDTLDGGSGEDICDWDGGDVASSCRSDSHGPQIVSLSVDDATLSPGDTLVVRARLRDPAGVEYAGVMSMVGGVQNDFCGQELTRASGTIYDGWWTRTCTVPSAVRTGTYTVTPYAQDKLGNYTNTNGGDTSPLTTTFTVTDRPVTSSTQTSGEAQPTIHDQPVPTEPAVSDDAPPPEQPALTDGHTPTSEPAEIGDSHQVGDHVAAAAERAAPIVNDELPQADVGESNTEASGQRAADS